MRVAVLSDIHANFQALQTAVASAEARGADRLVNLGDLVGYGPALGPCVDLVRAEFAVNILGNHDVAVLGDDIEYLPSDAQTVVKRHRDELSADQIEWLAGLPLEATAFGARFVHAAPKEPERWPRLETSRDTRAQFEAFDEPICFIGHSHRPAIVSETIGVFRVRAGHRYLIDVGSVGQPRDRDPRLAYAIYDEEAFTVEVVREHYDLERTIVDIGRAKLPPGLGERLRRGV